ncbi:MAG: bacteriohemerythrin [Rhodocyclaceae bacterium]|jgi:hemerythrin|nr:bacteriohemerythrin [Rhodocyclaceae bacterium]
MASFVWDENFVTGIEDVDAQHMELVQLINHLGDLLASPDSQDTLRLTSLLDKLSDYARFHFASEEGLMLKAGIDPQHLAMQQREHENFIEEVARLSHAGLNPSSANQLLDFLIHWLAYHILGSDMSMARQLRLMEQGMSAEQARDEDARLGTRATEPLLAALNGLFTQVSERNRELFELNRTLEARVEERTHELAEANRQLEELSLTDVLTGLPNRRHAMRRLSLEWADSHQPLALMMIDADGFKQINDTQGHDAGDEVLRILSQTLRDAVRNDDLVCRLGGDEFLVICPNTPLKGALHLAGLVLARVRALRVPAGNGAWVGSVSIGVGAHTQDMQSLDELIKLSDEGVYRAKREGRNRVCTVAEDI